MSFEMRILVVIFIVIMCSCGRNGYKQSIRNYTDTIQLEEVPKASKELDREQLSKGMNHKFVTNYYKVDLLDSFALNSIRRYIEENKLKPDSVIVNLSVRVNDHRIILYINHDIFNLNLKKNLPSSYTIIDEYLIFLYSEIDSFIKDRTLLRKEIEAVIENKNIRLKDKRFIYEPPIWSVVKCGGRVDIYIGEYYENNLPCGFYNDVVDGKIVVKEEEWFKDLKKKKK